MSDKQIIATYKPRNKKQSTEYRIHPLGIVNRHGVIHLVCTLWNYQDTKQLALHRFVTARIAEEKANRPKSFKLSAYVKSDNQFAYPISDKPIQLKVLFEPKVAEHLYETPLTQNQKLEAQKDGRLLLEASIVDTQELRW